MKNKFYLSVLCMLTLSKIAIATDIEKVWTEKEDYYKANAAPQECHSHTWKDNIEIVNVYHISDQDLFKSIVPAYPKMDPAVISFEDVPTDFPNHNSIVPMGIAQFITQEDQVRYLASEGFGDCSGVIGWNKDTKATFMGHFTVSNDLNCEILCHLIDKLSTDDPIIYLISSKYTPQQAGIMSYLAKRGITLSGSYIRNKVAQMDLMSADGETWFSCKEFYVPGWKTNVEFPVHEIALSFHDPRNFEIKPAKEKHYGLQTNKIYALNGDEIGRTSVIFDTEHGHLYVLDDRKDVFKKYEPIFESVLHSDLAGRVNDIEENSETDSKISGIKVPNFKGEFYNLFVK